MNKYDFATNPESQAFCDSIASRMVGLFGITTVEAVGRINLHWSGLSFLGPHDLLYHEDEDFWSHDLYYGPDSKWWINPPDLKPLPYP